MRSNQTLRISLRPKSLPVRPGKLRCHLRPLFGPRLAIQPCRFPGRREQRNVQLGDVQGNHGGDRHGSLAGNSLAIRGQLQMGHAISTGIKATKTYGDEDVWDFTFNSSDAAVEYVHFRDFANRIVYAGGVREFSETDKLRELVLRDRPDRQGLARADGYTKLAEGYIRKGGSNTATSQVQARPAPPAPMQPKPAASQGSGSTARTPSGTK